MSMNICCMSLHREKSGKCMKSAIPIGHHLRLVKTCLTLKLIRFRFNVYRAKQVSNSARIPRPFTAVNRLDLTRAVCALKLIDYPCLQGVGVV